MIIAVIVYLLEFFPAFSISYPIVDIYAASRFFSLIFIPFLFPLKQRLIFKKYNLIIYCLIIYYLVYSVIALIENRDFLIYIGYFIAFLYIFFINEFVYRKPNYFLNFFNFFFWANICYTLFQLILLNLHIMQSYTMIHSNLPAQIDYSIPLFISEPFYRYTGLFNESSPYAFYLSIVFSMYTYLQITNKKYKLYKYIALLTLLCSGSKFAYFFILTYYTFSLKTKWIKMINIVLLFVVFLGIDFSNLSFYGQFASLHARYQSLVTNLDISDFLLLGKDLEKTSEGNLGLDFFSIYLNGFGMLGFLIFVLFIILLYVYHTSEYKKKFILPFFLGLLASGSLLNSQYSLIIACLSYIASQDKSKY